MSRDDDFAEDASPAFEPHGLFDLDAEAPADELQHDEPRSNAALGLEIVKVIEAAETSLRRSGQPVGLESLSLAA